MNKNALVEFSIARPKLIFGLVLLITLVFAAQLPKIQLDTNPKNMLPPTSGPTTRQPATASSSPIRCRRDCRGERWNRVIVAENW